MNQKSPEICPVCGEDVPKGSLGCPECGADHASGWRESAESHDGLDLPDDEFNYDEFVQEEFGTSHHPRIHPVWWIAALVLLVALLVTYFH